MQLTKNSVNSNIPLTLSEKTTIENPYYLFEFINEYTNVKYYQIFTDVSVPGAARERSNLFNIEVVDSAAGANQIVLGNIGLYKYNIYEQASSTNLDPALSGAIVEERRMRLIDSSDDVSIYIAHETVITYVAHEQ
jgi:hypothetical protein